ncbi:MAG: methyltransferase domain-containing protein [Bacteroidia bacterium]
MMDRYEETFQTWNKIAELYETKFMDLDLYNDSYDYICHSLAVINSKILEIGCGPGNITKYLLNQRPDFDILGIDVAPNMIELAQKNNPTARFAVMDCRQIEEIQTQFEGIVCGFCLPYLSQNDSLTFISDCSNLLKAKGLLYVSFVEGEPSNSAFQVGSSGERSYFYFHRLNDLKIVLLQNGFEEIEVFKVKYKRTETEIEVHTILVAKKR